MEIEKQKWLLYDSNQNRKRSVGEAQLLVAKRWLVQGMCD